MECELIHVTDVESLGTSRIVAISKPLHATRMVQLDTLLQYVKVESL